MPIYYTFRADRETAERVGARGTFQVIELLDGEDLDQTHLIDTGQHYQDEDQLKNDIAKSTGVSVDEIILQEED